MQIIRSYHEDRFSTRVSSFNCIIMRGSEYLATLSYLNTGYPAYCITNYRLNGPELEYELTLFRNKVYKWLSGEPISDLPF